MCPDLVRTNRNRFFSMTKHQQNQWILNWCRTHGGIDTLCGPASVEFSQLTGSRLIEYPYGPSRSPLLARRISELYHSGMLQRGTLGVREGRGFPKWIYAYTLRK